MRRASEGVSVEGSLVRRVHVELRHVAKIDSRVVDVWLLRSRLGDMIVKWMMIGQCREPCLVKVMRQRGAVECRIGREWRDKDWLYM